MFNKNKLGFFLILWIALVSSLVGCSGGGGDNSASGSSVPSGPSFSLSSTELSAQADTSGSAPIATVNVAVLNPPSETYYYRYTWSGTAVNNVAWSWTENTTARMTITLWTPANAGAGTYSSVIQLQFCLDSACTRPFADSPKNISITYTVTGDSLPATSFNFSPSVVSVESKSTGAPPDAQFPFYIVNPPPYPTYVHLRSASGGVVSKIEYASDVSPPHLTISFLDPNSMTAGNHEDTLLVDVCFDSACSRKSKDSPKAISLSYSVLAKEGSEYSRTTVGGNAEGLAWDPHSERIYAAIKGSSQFAGNALEKINPTNGVIEASLTLDGMPSALALSDDGQYAYVVYRAANSFEDVVARVRLDNMSLDTVIHLQMIGNWVYADDLMVAPGNATTFAILTRRAYFQGVNIYEDGVKTGEWGEVTSGAAIPSSYFLSVQWAGSSSRLYVYDESKDVLNSLSYLNGALALTSATPSFNAGCTDTAPILCRWGPIRFGAGAITSGFGAVLNIISGSISGYYPLGSSIIKPALAIDGTNHRTYFYYNDLVSPVVKSFDSNTMKLVAAARIEGLDLGGNIGAHVSHIIRWGQNGLAMNTPTGIVIINGSFVTQ